MSWICPKCGLALNVKKIIYPIRCKCGHFDHGRRSKKTSLVIRTPISPWEKDYRLSVCGQCAYHNNGRCIHIDLGCSRTFQKVLSDPYANCPKDKWGLVPSPFNTPIKNRHCIYHIYAKRDDDIWLKNIEKLRKNTHIFNGKRIAAIAFDQFTVPVDEVKKELPGFDFIETRNDPELRETVSFPKLLKLVMTPEEDAIFYAHTKGNTTTNNKQGAAIWRNVMYRELLDNYEQCLEHLKQYIAVGIHKMSWPIRPAPFPSKLDFGNRWMFAGTFFWFRTDALYQANWKTVPIDRYGAEGWLSGSLKSHEGKSVYQCWDENNYPDISPYSPLTYPSRDREAWKK